MGRGLDREEIADFRAQGFTINNDNKPVEENVGPTGPIPTGTWMRPAFCPRKAKGCAWGSNQQALCRQGYWIL